MPRERILQVVHSFCLCAKLDLSYEDCAALTKFSKTRSRYVSLAAVLKRHPCLLLLINQHKIHVYRLSTGGSPVSSQAFVNVAQFNLHFGKFYNLRIGATVKSVDAIF
jgi:hypothetical protein